jgi:predicted RNase H-like HicB family nuclease
MKKYLVLFEQTDNNWGAYSPDVPGCVATGATKEECEQMFREALEFHLESLRDHGDPIPEPSTEYSFVEIAA